MSTRSQVLAALRASGDGGLSGEDLAEHLGVSRVAVSKHVATLRDAGYDIVSTPGVGYRFLSAPDAALPDEVRPLVTSAFWTRFEGGASTGSTNDDARGLAIGGTGEGTVVTAAEQTAGRGRLGRTWVSPGGGAYLSAVLRPQVAPAEIGPLPLVVGLGVAAGLERLGIEARLKWPNDVLIGDAKVSGILLEMSAEHDHVGWVVAGVGVNAVRTEQTPEGAACVSDAAPGVRVAEVAAAVLDGIADRYGVWLEEGFDALADEYAARDALEGRSVTVRGMDGTLIAGGIGAGVDASGRLLVAGGDGAVTAVATGDVTLRS